MLWVNLRPAHRARGRQWGAAGRVSTHRQRSPAPEAAGAPGRLCKPASAPGNWPAPEGAWRRRLP